MAIRILDPKIIAAKGKDALLQDERHRLRVRGVRRVDTEWGMDRLEYGWRGQCKYTHCLVLCSAVAVAIRNWVGNYIDDDVKL